MYNSSVVIVKYDYKKRLSTKLTNVRKNVYLKAGLIFENNRGKQKQKFEKQRKYVALITYASSEIVNAFIIFGVSNYHTPGNANAHYLYIRRARFNKLLLFLY